MILYRNSPVYVGFYDRSAEANPAIRRSFDRHAGGPEIRRTHFFGGRFENVYLNLEQVPEMAGVMAQARELAAEILELDPAGLAAGLWFNAMEPGQATLPHSHDDAYELLSGVYYVEVPEDSGSLVITEGRLRTTVSPEPGMFVFFPADAVHEVTRNLSELRRLSVGMNFGAAGKHGAGAA